MASVTLGHTGAGTYTGGAYYNGAAGTTGAAGDSAPWRSTWAMAALPDTVDRILSLVAKIQGSTEAEGPDLSATIYWHTGASWVEDVVDPWPVDLPAPPQEQRSSAPVTTSIPSVGQWNANGEVGLDAAGVGGRSDRDGHWSTPLCTITYDIDEGVGEGLIQLLGLLPPFIGPLGTLLAREWAALRVALARHRQRHRFTLGEWELLVRGARAHRSPRRLVLTPRVTAG